MPFGFNFNPFNLFGNNEVEANAPTRRNVITFEEGLKTLQEGIVKLFNILEGSEPNFTSEEYIKLYTYVSISIYFIETTLYCVYICSSISILSKS
jgi:hypothetical protein